MCYFAFGWMGQYGRKRWLMVVWPQGTKHDLVFLPDFFKNCVPNFLLDLVGLRLNCWNDGSQLFGAEPAGIDDMGFLQAMIAEITTTWASTSATSSSRSAEVGFALDTNRIYMSGHSNGATMAQRFALQTNGLLAGVIAISGAGMPGDPLWSPGGDVGSDYSATSIIFVSGTIDGVVPFFERLGPLAGAMPSLGGWAAVNGCTASGPAEENFDGYSRYAYDECSGTAQVILLKILEAGHHPFTKGEDPLQISPVDVIASK